MVRRVSGILADFIRSKATYFWNQTRVGLRFAGYFRVLTDGQAGWWLRLRYALGGLAALGAAGVALVLTYALILIPFTPSTSELKKAKVEQPTLLLSSDGKELARYRRLYREWVKLDQISPHVVDALIATEDRRFYDHHGIDLKRTAAAVVYTVRGERQGGSTITQQLARNLFPDDIGRAPTLTRKLKEAITALKIELLYSKKEILETYLNTVPFLYNAFGIEMAARTYFDKSAGELSVLEAATLIGMLKGTAYYNPVLNPERAVDRRNTVLGQMVKFSKLPEKKFESLRKKPLVLDFERQVEPVGPAPHFAEQVRKWLIDWADRNGYNIYSDGLVVRTTLDARLQNFANKAVARQMEALQAVADVEWGEGSGALLSTSLRDYTWLRQSVAPFGHFFKSRTELVNAFIRETPAYRAAIESGVPEKQALARLRADKTFIKALRQDKTRLQAGFVALDPRTGQVRAWVGSRDFEQDKYDHVVLAKRQPGSTFKPFVYAAALKQGMGSNDRFDDAPVEIPLGNGAVWRPSDAHPATGRSMTLREALAQSKNTITAQVMQQVGAKNVVRTAYDLGVRQGKLDPVPSLALGTSPVTLMEMVNAYGTIANGGEYQAPVLVTRIEDRNGKVLATFGPPTKERVLTDAVARELFDMMRGVVDRGTGTGIRYVFGLQGEFAGKTGTTQNNTDGWFILMNHQLVAGAWVGFNDARITMRSDYWGQGAHNALYLVGDFFQQIYPPKRIEPPKPPEAPRESPLGPLLDQVQRWFKGL